MPNDHRYIQYRNINQKLNEMYNSKDIDVVMLPTKEKSDIVKNNGVNKLYFEEGLEYKDDEYQHLYITSNEEIKEGDYVNDILALKIHIADEGIVSISKHNK